MKKLLFTMMAGSMISFFSCTKDSTVINSTSASSNNNLSGNSGPSIKSVNYVWKINSLMDNGTDISSQFAGYTFEINAPLMMVVSGEIIAVNGQNTYYGKWERTSFNQVTIGFPSASGIDIFNSLNGDWTITNIATYDLNLQGSQKTLSFHTDGTIWKG